AQLRVSTGDGDADRCPGAVPGDRRGAAEAIGYLGESFDPGLGALLGGPGRGSLIGLGVRIAQAGPPESCAALRRRHRVASAPSPRGSPIRPKPWPTCGNA